MEIVWRGRDKVCYDKVEIFIENGKIPIQSGYLGRTRVSRTDQTSILCIVHLGQSGVSGLSL